MGALVDDTVLEAEISGCLQAIYQAPDPESAMRYWNKLSSLKEQRVAAENQLFQIESRGLSKRD
jgi:hypothetical protein